MHFAGGNVGPLGTEAEVGVAGEADHLQAEVVEEPPQRRAFVRPLVEDGKVRALGVTTAQRSAVFPDVPAIGEFVPGYEASLRNGLGAPRATPADIIARLNAEVNAGLNDPGIKAKFADLGSETVPMTPADYGKLIAEKTEKWGKVIRDAGIKAQ